MEYAILGNAAFFAVAFAAHIGWLSLDMLSLGQDDDDDDVAVKNLDPEDPKRTGYTASNYTSEEVGTSGNDTLGVSSNTSSVALFGLSGNDSLVGTVSDDYFEGDAGSDTINAFDGHDAAHGGSGHDIVIGFEWNDTILGDDGDDLIEGNTGEDHLFGGPGADSIAGGEGRDSVNGGAGNDLLSSDRLDRSADFSRGGGETLIGAEGEDTIIFSNADQVSGGGDADTFHYVYRDVTSDPVVINDFDKDMDTLTLHYPPQTDGQGNPIVPSISFQIDASIGETLIKLDGVIVAKLQGNVSISSADVILAEYDAPFLDRL